MVEVMFCLDDKGLDTVLNEGSSAYRPEEKNLKLIYYSFGAIYFILFSFVLFTFATIPLMKKYLKRKAKKHRSEKPIETIQDLDEAHSRSPDV